MISSHHILLLPFYDELVLLSFENRRSIFFLIIGFCTILRAIDSFIKLVGWGHHFDLEFNTILLSLLRFIDPFILWNKVSLQTSLERNPSNLSYIYFLGVNFENLTIEFYVPYILNMHIKFRSNWMLYTIRSINLFFIHTFRTQKLEILTFV